MNLKPFQYALVLAQAGSFSKAAEELGISQPSLSQYIKKAEQQAGTALFDRTNGNVRPTDAGLVYLETGRKALALAHEMEIRFSDIAAGKSGSVIVGTTPFRSAGIMPAVTRRFRETYPGICVVVKEHNNSDLLEAAEKGEFDLCLTLLPEDGKPFVCRPVAQEELVLAVPASFPALPAEPVRGRKYPAVDARRIDGQPFVMVSEAQVMQRALNRLCQACGLTLTKSAVVNSLEAQISMVRAGLGMALVPTGIERFCSDREVVFYSLRQPLPRRKVVVLWRKDRPLSRVVQHLADVMQSVCR